MEKEQDRKQWKFQSGRLSQRDYGKSGAYFVTICAYQRQPCFRIPELEQILKQQWQELPQHFPGISLDRFVIMPDHLHFIVWIDAHVHYNRTFKLSNEGP
jgi:REP element-mobilizing transposase RayT